MALSACGKPIHPRARKRAMALGKAYPARPGTDLAICQRSAGCGGADHCGSSLADLRRNLAKGLTAAGKRRIGRLQCFCNVSVVREVGFPRRVEAEIIDYLGQIEEIGRSARSWSRWGGI